MKSPQGSGAFSLGLANALALLAAFGAAAAYARWLQPAEFTHWTAALAIARAGLLLWGPRGLAIGSAVSGWAGVLPFMNAGSSHANLSDRWRALVPAELALRALWISLGLALWVQARPVALPWATEALLLAWWVYPAAWRKAWTRRAEAGRMRRHPNPSARARARATALGQDSMQPPISMAAPPGTNRHA
jgi:hypothetical protein